MSDKDLLKQSGWAGSAWKATKGKVDDIVTGITGSRAKKMLEHVDPMFKNDVELGMKRFHENQAMKNPSAYALKKDDVINPVSKLDVGDSVRLDMANLDAEKQRISDVRKYTAYTGLGAAGLGVGAATLRSPKQNEAISEFHNEVDKMNLNKGK